MSEPFKPSPPVKMFNGLPDVADTYAAAVGYIAIHWALIEEAFGAILYVSLDLQSPAGTALVAEMNGMARVNAVSVMVRLLGKTAYIDEWTGLLARFNELRPLRNDAVHGEWMRNGPGHTIRRVKAKGAFKEEYYEVPVAELSKLDEELGIFYGQLIRFSLSLYQGGIIEILKLASPPGLTDLSLSPTPLVRSKAQAPKKKQPRAPRPSSAQRRSPKKKEGSS